MRRKNYIWRAAVPSGIGEGFNITLFTVGQQDGDARYINRQIITGPG
jgi:hypothetical protein